MDSILPLTQPPLILVKDFSNRADWTALDNLINLHLFSKDNNYNITQDKKFLKNSLDLSKELTAECKAFVSNVCPMSFDFDLQITDSWVNSMQYGEQHPWHAHPFSVVSGVLFLDDHPENGELTFKHNINHSIPPYSLLEMDFYTSLKQLIDSESSATTNLKHHLVLFYSNTNHGVPALITRGLTRRTLSFNTFWHGHVNFGDELNSKVFL